MGRSMHTGEQALRPLADGSYIFTGSTYKSGNGTGDVFIQKLLPNGDTTQAIIYPAAKLGEYPTDLLVTPNGDYMILGKGYTDVGANFCTYYFVQRVTATGATVFYKHYAKSGSSYPSRMIVNQKGNYVLSGMSVRNSPNPIMWHPYFIEITPNGDSVQSKSIILKDPNHYEMIYRIFNNILLTTDGNYVFNGTLDSADYTLGYVAQVDKNFNLQWLHTIKPRLGSKETSLSKIHALRGGGYLQLSEAIARRNKLYLTKISSTGKFISEQTFTSQACERLWSYDWSFINDSSMVIQSRCTATGQLHLVRLGIADPVKPTPLPPPVKPEEPTIPQEPPVPPQHPKDPEEPKSPLPEPEQELYLGQSYPNPAQGQPAKIPYYIPSGTHEATLYIYNSIGTLVNSKTISTRRAGEISVADLASGIYAYCLIADGHFAGYKRMSLRR